MLLEKATKIKLAKTVLEWDRERTAESGKEMKKTTIRPEYQVKSKAKAKEEGGYGRHLTEIVDFTMFCLRYYNKQLG